MCLILEHGEPENTSAEQNVVHESAGRGSSVLSVTKPEYKSENITLDSSDVPQLDVFRMEDVERQAVADERSVSSGSVSHELHTVDVVIRRLSDLESTENNSNYEPDEYETDFEDETGTGGENTVFETLDSWSPSQSDSEKREERETVFEVTSDASSHNNLVKQGHRAEVAAFSNSRGSVDNRETEEMPAISCPDEPCDGSEDETFEGDEQLHVCDTCNVYVTILNDDLNQSMEEHNSSADHMKWESIFRNVCDSLIPHRKPTGSRVTVPADDKLRPMSLLSQSEVAYPFGGIQYKLGSNEMALKGSFEDATGASCAPESNGVGRKQFFEDSFECGWNDEAEQKIPFGDATKASYDSKSNKTGRKRSLEDAMGTSFESELNGAEQKRYFEDTTVASSDSRSSRVGQKRSFQSAMESSFELESEGVKRIRFDEDAMGATHETTKSNDFNNNKKRWYHCKFCDTPFRSELFLNNHSCGRQIGNPGQGQPGGGICERQNNEGPCERQSVANPWQLATPLNVGCHANERNKNKKCVIHCQRCDWCNYSLTEVNVHLKSQRHLLSLRDRSGTNYSSPLLLNAAAHQTTVDQVESPRRDINNGPSDDNIAASGNGHYRCHLCNVTLPSGSHARNHEIGKNHQKRLNEKCGKGRKASNGDSGNGFCDLCNVPVCANNFDAHLLGRKHRERSKRRGNVSDSRRRSSSSQNAIPESRFTITGKNRWSCFVCNVTSFTMNNYKEHIREKTHEDNVADVSAKMDESDPYLEESDVGVWCSLCNVLCPEQSQLVPHIRTARHCQKVRCRGSVFRLSRMS